METSPRRIERGDWGRNGEGMDGGEFQEGENGWLSKSHLGSDSSAGLVLMHVFF